MTRTIAAIAIDRVVIVTLLPSPHRPIAANAAAALERAGGGTSIATVLAAAESATGNNIAAGTVHAGTITHIAQITGTGRCPAVDADHLDKILRAVVIGAVAGFGDVTHTRRSMADGRVIVEVRGTGGATARAGFGDITGPGSRTAGVAR